MAFSYRSSFQDALTALRREGRYRVFADILRERGAYPKAGLHDPGRFLYRRITRAAQSRSGAVMTI